MSLKTFHLVFITLSIALAVLFAAWAFSLWRAAGSAPMLITAVGSLVAGAGLAGYEAAFVKKCRAAGIR